MRHARRRRAPEKAVEASIDRLCALAGCTPIRFSQARATQQTPGIPDRRYYAPAARLAFWVEVKAPGGRQSADQAAFQALCDACDDPYVLGGYRAVLEFLIARGLWHLPAGISIDDVCRERERT